jgi:hypothetical protein
MRGIIMISVVFLFVAVLLAPGLAAAQADDWPSWPLGEKFAVSVNAFFPNLDTTVRVDASDGSPGTSISFEQNLGMANTESLPSYAINWRFAKKHSILLSHFTLNRSGSAVTSSEIRFGDEVFEIDLPISSFFDTDVIGLAYSYSLAFDEKKEFALSLGLSVQDISMGLRGNAGLGIISETSGVTAPLPTIGISGGYAFTDKLTVRGGVGIFAFKLSLDNSEELDGRTSTAAVGLFHRTFEHVEFGIVYNYFDIDVDFIDTGRLSEIDYTYHGPMIAVAAVF